MHPESTELIDYLELRLSARARASVESHLQAACRRCGDRLRRYRLVLDNLRAGALTDVPEGLLQAALGLFPSAKGNPAWPWVEGRLVYDSFGSTASAGVRGEATARRLLFEAPGLELDVRVDSGGTSTRLTAQVLDGDAEPMAECSFRVLQQGREIARGLSDDQGNFSAVLSEGGDVEIHLKSAQGRARFLLPD